MAGSKEIKRRIKSVKSTKKITKAMELVAASKMKRAVSSTLASRLYAEYSWEILTSLAENLEEINHPLLVSRPVKKTLLVLITSNRGLCGAYNSQVIKKVLGLLRKEKKEHFDIITIGRKGDTAMRRIGQNVIATFNELPAQASLTDIIPISKLAVEEFTKGNYDRVLVSYTEFVSGLTQTPNIKQILPVSKAEIKELIEIAEAERQIAEGERPKKTDYLIEGDKTKLLGSLAEKLSRMQLYQMILESNASEQSARMLAMKNASDAAGEMIDDLTLVYNKARQSSITQEISEISAGMAAVN